ncbi:MAG: DUF4920 domain-containing protein [Bryobacteraceae bacterium]
MRITLALLISLSTLLAADLKLGKPLTLKQPTPIASLADTPEQYVGKTVQAKGKVTEVCQKMGCWMNLADENGKLVRIKVKDGEIVFPKDSIGKIATAEGKFAKLEMTKEQAAALQKHEAEVNGKKFDPASVTGPVTIYQINGSGAVIAQ